MEYINNDKNYTDPYLKGKDLNELINLLNDKNKDYNNFNFSDIIIYFDKNLSVKFNINQFKCFLNKQDLTFNYSDILKIELVSYNDLYSFIELLKIINQNKYIDFNSNNYHYDNYKIFL